MFFKTSYYSSNKQKTNLQMSDVSVNRPSSADEGLLTETSDICKFVFCLLEE